MVAADVVDQCTRRRNAETFVRHKHQVVAVGEIDRLEQRVEAFFFAVKDSGDISFRADYIDAGVGKMSAHDFRGLHRAQIVANFERADSDAATGVRFFEVAAYIVNNVPIDAVVLDVVRHESLREISVAKLFVLGQLHDLRAGLIVDLPHQRGQRVVRADF